MNDKLSSELNTISAFMNTYRQVSEVIKGAHLPVSLLAIQVLHMLNTNGPQPVYVCAANLDVTRSAVSTEVKRLLKSDFIKLKNDVHDRRITIMSITTTGLLFLQSTNELIDNIYNIVDVEEVAELAE
ncbi:MarR family winged helix-turn-helix transcriptional regulator [Furfurilactobacillus entadae]|uniref:MarR family winged helix-turn-helix transcriptional regulator n=1 Tax=Furfurilactobacillus entadae TaxID=2922307 RepID=UPI0035EAF0D2